MGELSDFHPVHRPLSILLAILTGKLWGEDDSFLITSRGVPERQHAESPVAPGLNPAHAALKGGSTSKLGHYPLSPLRGLAADESGKSFAKIADDGISACRSLLLPATTALCVVRKFPGATLAAAPGSLSEFCALLAS
jgi:hypothetical protein